MFSTSIMDYNDYEIELAAFSAIDSSDGPLLEYDRQAMDRDLQSGRATYSDNDPMVPTCNDAEADNESGGVDPLCIRYDIEKDPTLSIGTALDRVRMATKAGDVTMAQSIARVPGIVLTADALAAVKSDDDLADLAVKVASSLKGAMQFYLTAGKASIAKTLVLNSKSLLEFADGVLKDDYSSPYDERGMHERAFAGVQQALSLKALPAPAAAALAQAVKVSLDALLQTPYVTGLGSQDRSDTTEVLTKALQSIGSSLEKDQAAGLPKLRATVLGSLARHSRVPFFFGKLEGMSQAMDIETSVVGILADNVTASGPAAASTAIERLTAAKALATFHGRAQGDAAIKASLNALTQARVGATDNASRELIEQLLSILKS